MPKEEPASSELRSSATSSKNAKNKSNRLLATRDAKDAGESAGRSSRCSSEKDSGYSDGSDWQQTDVEDQQSNKSPPAETKDPEQGNSGNAALMPAGHEVQAVYILSNMVLKQPAVIQRRGQLRSGGRETSSGHVMLPRLLPLHTPSSRKSNITARKATGSYLPILNSYPRIAPHPSKKSSGNDDPQSLSKRVCTERRGEDAPASRRPPQQHLSKHSRAAVTSEPPCASSAGDESQASPAGSALCAGSAVLPSRALLRNGAASSRHRFLNTLEILRRSGLLDITLRTKELLRQSSATEHNIGQLRQHTELLRQAASGAAAWQHLHRAMAESGSYPNLKNLPLLRHPGSDTKGPGGAESAEAVPPTPRPLTAGLDPTRDKPSEKVTFTPPDSSTG